MRLRFVVLSTLIASTGLAGPAQVAQQKALAEATANGKNDVDNGNPRAKQKSHTKACGQALNVTFDWKSFPDEDVTKENQGFMCIEGILDALTYYCEGSDVKDTYKPAVSKVVNLVCHYKPCDQLPRQLKDQPKSPPRWDYKLSKDGKTIDKYTCKDAGNSGSFKETDWIKDSF